MGDRKQMKAKSKATDVKVAPTVDKAIGSEKIQAQGKIGEPEVIARGKVADAKDASKKMRG